MKKLGLIVLALVIALGTLGVGYAMWSDTIFVNGTVETGTVDINLTRDFSATYVYKTMPGGGNVISATELTDTEQIDYTLISSAIAESNGDDAVEFTFDNLFPIFDSYGNPASYCADFTAKYEGTIPVHVVWDWALLDEENNLLVRPEAISDPAIKELLYYYTTISYSINDDEQYGTIAPADTQLIQLHQDDVINIKVCIEIPQVWDSRSPNTEFVPEGENTQAYLSDKDFSFVGKFIVYQWNEAAPSVNLSDLIPSPSPSPSPSPTNDY